MATAADILFGRLVLQGSLATRQQLEACLEQLGGQSLPHVLVSCRLLDMPTAQRLARLVGHRQFLRGELIFGQLLMRSGLVSRVALREAFEIQKRGGSRERLAKILFDCRLMSQEQIEQVVDAQLLELAEEAARIVAQGLVPPEPRPAPSPLQVELPTQEMPRPTTPAPERVEHDPAARIDDYLAEDTMTVDSAVLSAAGVEDDLTASDIDLDVSAPPPTEPPTELTFSAARIVRAFESAMLMAGIRGMLWRQSPEEGQAISKPITVIWDASREMFKSPLEPGIASTDLFQLTDGNVFQVARCKVLEIEGTPCYQQVWVASLGISMESIRESWEGIVPDPQQGQ